MWSYDRADSFRKKSPNVFGKKTAPMSTLIVKRILPICTIFRLCSTDCEAHQPARDSPTIGVCAIRHKYKYRVDWENLAQSDDGSNPKIAINSNDPTYRLV